MQGTLGQYPLAARVGLTGIVLTLAMGLAASMAHLRGHSAKRDQQPGFSLDDVRAAYRGLKGEAPMGKVLRDGHAPQLPQQDRDALLAWLASPNPAATFADPDAVELTPQELMSRSCASCHDGAGSASKGGGVRLSSWGDIERYATVKNFDPTPREILLVSTHTHATGMGTLAAVLAAGGLLTRWRRGAGVLTGVMGVGVLIDIASWWLARGAEFFVPMIVLGGGMFGLGSGLLCVLVLAELWLPIRKGRA
jgi:hypothetical protein